MIQGAEMIPSICQILMDLQFTDDYETILASTAFVVVLTTAMKWNNITTQRQQLRAMR